MIPGVLEIVVIFGVLYSLLAAWLYIRGPGRVDDGDDEEPEYVPVYPPDEYRKW